MKQKIIFLIFFGLLQIYGQDLEVHFINVGQGDSILVKTPDNKAILIDAGIHYTFKNKYNPFNYLKSQNIKCLDAIFITHPHDDHYKGFKYLCSQKGKKEFSVKAVYCSVEPGPEYGQFQDCLESIINESEEFDLVSARGPPLKFGEVIFIVLNPKEPILEPSKNKNRDSIVMRMIYKNVSFIFTGDADREVEASLKGDLKSTVLKVGHHGSKSSTDKVFLKRVNPEYAVISCNARDGKGKTYLHPHEPVLKSLKAWRVKLYRTDLNGSIIMKSDGNTINVIPETEASQDLLWEPGKK